MSVVYQQLITELQAETYLDGGFDHFFGLAVDAGETENVTEVADLIDLFQCSGEYSLFSPDEPVDVLHAPAHPFVHVRRAVGALHPDSFLGGITEYPPYDGTGIAEANMSTPPPDIVAAQTALSNVVASPKRMPVPAYIAPSRAVDRRMVFGRAPITPSNAPSWRRVRPTIAMFATPPTPATKKIGTMIVRKPLTPLLIPLERAAPPMA